MCLLPPLSTLFPYTTLFRSVDNLFVGINLARLFDLRGRVVGPIVESGFGHGHVGGEDHLCSRAQTVGLGNQIFLMQGVAHLVPRSSNEGVRDTAAHYQDRKSVV